MTEAGRISGFTLIELITVIAILGVLSAVAAPRYVDLRGSAHQAVVAGTAGAFAAAIQLANLGCIARNFRNLDNMPGLGTGNVDFNANCYPSSTNGNNGNVNNNRCLQVWNGILTGAPTISTPLNDTTDYRSQVLSTNVCTFTYRKDTATVRRFTYNATTGAIVVTNP